ncbi:MAG: Flp family type IVb pilin [Acidimicrobiia bacterium]
MLWIKVLGRANEEKGASMVEYALLIVLIAIVAIIAIRLAGDQISEAFSDIGSGLD